VAALLEQVLRVGFLEIAAADLARREVCGDAEHRHARSVTIEEPIDEMQIARPATARAHRELSGKVRLGAGGKGAGLLLPCRRIASVRPLRLSPTTP
jgi:hypothetical protein